MNITNQNIKFADQLDVSNMIKEFDQLPDAAWQENLPWTNPKNLSASNIGDYSKQAGGSVVREQRRVFLKWHKSPDHKPFYEHSDYRNFETELTQWGDQCPLTLHALTEYFDRFNQRIVRLYLSILDPGKQIYPHPDQRPGLTNGKELRYGLAVTTNEQCLLTCAGEPFHVPAGTMYWMDNYKEHSATNFGPSTRIHVYMDVI